MILNNQPQTLLLILRSFTSGLVLCVIYDFFSVALGKIGKEKRSQRIAGAVLGFAFDFLFCILCALNGILLMYYANKGFFRSLVFLFMFLGFVCFRLSLGKLLRKALSVVYDFLLKPIIFIKNKLILLLHLTIGKILGKIVLKVRTFREKRKARKEAEAEQSQIPQEDFVYVAPGKGYRKGNRIKF